MNSSEEDNNYMSSDEENSEVIREEKKDVFINTKIDPKMEPNIKCGSCKKNFYFDKKVSNIRCNFCGYRILQKLRTKKSIYYNTD